MSGDQDMGAFASDAVAEAPTPAIPDEPLPGRILAEAPAAPVEDEPEFVGRDAFQPKVIEPPAEPEPVDESTTTDAPKAPLLTPGTTVTVIYRGSADVADLKGPDGMGEHDYRFRPGQPVDVPSEVAEELLTWPGEAFEIVEPKE